jgi:Leucine-rich repeat (LRR) protein
MDAASAPPAAASSSASPGAAASSPAPDLSITFNPDFTDHLGWVLQKTLVPLGYVGNPGVTIQRFDTDWQPSKNDAVAQKIFELQLAKVDWSATSVLLGEGHLCSPQLRDVINRANPSRLLLRIEGGLTDVGVGCLRELSTPRMYLAGCLYRSHRRDERCNGDAELRALASDEVVRKKVGGLAVSLSKGASVAQLRQFPALEYLAIASGREPEPGARFAELPFEALTQLRYLDITSWTDEQTVWGGPDELRFMGHLHTLHWQGRFSAPLGACQLRRLSSGRVKDDDLKALATCSQLVELSTDSADIESAAALAAFSRLERLHLRHLRAPDLSPLVKLTALRELSLPASKASAFGFISRLSELRRVVLSQTSLSELTSFEHLEHLERLDVGFTRVADLTPLRRLGALVELELHDTQVVDIAPLAGLRLLKELNLSTTAVTDLSPLREHPALEWIVLHDSKLLDVGALLTMPNLKRAHIGHLSLPPQQLAALKQRFGYQLDGAP